jgi:hypothetical protein
MIRRLPWSFFRKSANGKEMIETQFETKGRRPLQLSFRFSSGITVPFDSGCLLTKPKGESRYAFLYEEKTLMDFSRVFVSLVLQFHPNPSLRIVMLCWERSIPVPVRPSIT